jgi:acyl-CoA carboxylase subunit alpha
MGGLPALSAFGKILIANRGEIALRVMRTCREMGIRTVGVYSEADRLAPHVRAAGEAVPIGPAPARDSYLRIDRLLEAARRTGAEAIHPGYGFLAENAEFAEACLYEGIAWIGPPPAAIRAMGLKSRGRELAMAAGVPVAPGWSSAQEIGEFPVLIKAAAGGGGRGMRIVRQRAELASAMESAQREAEKAFGDGTLLFERYLEGARHVEIQILGDQHGGLVHLFERDCSLQRRHQKIIEECPSPAVDADLRARMGAAAVALGRALHYTSAGTVEFLLAPSGDFFFIEVNTRIQVEHPVTEMVTGLDLVRLQIEIAEGRPLPPEVLGARLEGHAMEARLYAEDPAHDFAPSTGTVHLWKPPAPAPGLRIESGIEAGSEIGIHYDPLLAKIIAHGADRERALRRLVQALESTAALGIRTNRQFLLQILAGETFRRGEVTTSYLPAFAAPPEDAAYPIALALYLDELAPARRPLLPGVPAGYRNNPFRDPSASFRSAAAVYPVSWRRSGPRRYQVNGAEVEVVACRPGAISAVIGGVCRHFEIHEAGGRFLIYTAQGSATLERVPRFPPAEAQRQHQTANSPMPGQVLQILVEKGQQVRAGDALVVLEAMKIEQTIRTAIDGMVAAILVRPGEVVAPGQNLVEISAEEIHASTQT